LVREVGSQGRMVSFLVQIEGQLSSRSAALATCAQPRCLPVLMDLCW
jgi:hypothetical protein